MGLVKKGKLTKKNFAFTGTMTCGSCGCSITAEEKIKKSGLRYVYYHCTSGKGNCPDVTYIEERKIDSWISEALTQIQIPEEIIEWTKKALQDSHSKEIEYQNLQRTTLENRYRTVENKINKAYEDKLEGHIDLDFWIQQNNRLQLELSSIESQLTQLRTSKESNMNQDIQLMELARQAPTLFKSMTTDEKRELVNLVLSNPRIENGSLRYDLKKPFSMFANVTNLEKWRRERDSNPRPSA
ncbi:MAG: recombinase zinc beta ribbon domain-containing protein [Bdellovibrio sp.]|nr:recombinase zinc beta ribbon domain-containing protein [Bdellovibrio sp.]